MTCRCGHSWFAHYPHPVSKERDCTICPCGFYREQFSYDSEGRYLEPDDAA